MDWIYTHKDMIISLIWLIVTLVAYFWPSLPIKAQIWLRKIGGKALVINILQEAETLGDMPDAGLRAFAKDKLEELALRKFGKAMPDSIANVLVEWTFNRYKRIIEATIIPDVVKAATIAETAIESTDTPSVGIPHPGNPPTASGISPTYQATITPDPATVAIPLPETVTPLDVVATEAAAPVKQPVSI